MVYKINYLYVLISELSQKFHADFKNYLKKFHTIPEEPNFFDLSFEGNDHANFSNCLGKAGLNWNRYRKKYRPLGRGNSKLFMKNPLKSGLSIKS